MKRQRNWFERRVYARLEAGLHPTRCQQAGLHVLTAWRNRRKLTPTRIAFHLRGIMRVFRKTG